MSKFKTLPDFISAIRSPIPLGQPKAFVGRGLHTLYPRGLTASCQRMPDKIERGSLTTDWDSLAVSVAIGVYVLCSSCMLVVNKASMKYLPHVYTVTAMQTAASAILLLAARQAGFIQFPYPTLSKMWSWSGILAAWIVPIILNMKAVHLLSVETMMMFRSVTIVAVAVGDLIWLRTVISLRQGIACLIISFGGMLYASNDLNFNAEGYFWGTLYALSMVVNSLYIKHCFNQHQTMSSWEKSFLNNLLATPALFAIIAAHESVSKIRQDMTTIPASGWAVLLLSCGMGLGISMSGTKCRDVLSATSFDVLGNCTKYLTLGISAWFLNAKNSAVSIVGICIALTGAALYSPAGEIIWTRKQQALPGKKSK